MNYGREIIQNWAYDHILYRYQKFQQKEFVLLDQGCGHGDDLYLIKRKIESDNSLKELTLKLYGIENFLPFIEEAKSKGIEIFNIDLEHDVYPLPKGSVDILITNQVLEHTKEIFWIMEQFVQLVKPDGILIIGVPNLASLHNRILLLLGEQPSVQQSLSAHVRAFTLPDLRRLVEWNGYFKFIERKGSNFYPFPPIISKPLAKVFPSFAWGLFAKFQRTHKHGSFLSFLEENFLETPFYGSPQNPAKRS
ncbi:MAG: class I SAM-dependent methyltransferase [Leptospiraceae bacterium]|nr:class I SAM-dependent methyltransferase [Leptospiraceae bacterium]